MICALLTTMYHLTFDNRQSQPVDELLLAARLEMVLQQEQVRSADVVIALVDDAEIHRVNREFLDHDWPTDVISFSYEDAGVPVSREIPRGRERELDGEIVVSVETASRCAAAHGWSLHAELLLYSVHGLLHLCGYDDLTDEERHWMRRRERELLATFNLSPKNLQA